MTRGRTRLRRHPDDRGAAAVEFALVLTVLLLIIFGIIDFGRLLFASQSMKAASREGARAAVVSTGNGQTVFDAASTSGSSGAALAGGAFSVEMQPPGVTLTSRPVTATPPHNDPQGAPGTGLCGAVGSNGSVTVTATTDFRWFTPTGIFASGIDEVSSSTTMRCE